MPNETVILGPDGRPATEFLRSASSEEGGDFEAVRRAFVAKTWGEFVKSLQSAAGEDPTARASKAFQTHAWVYACAMAAAVQFSTAPFTVYQDTEEETQRRRMAVKRAGRKWAGPRSGSLRTAIGRQLQSRRRLSGMKIRGAEPFFDHPLMPVMMRPNPSMSGGELWMGTALLMQLRGEAFWHLITPSGRPWMTGDPVEQIKLYNPDWMSPLYGPEGIIAWRVRVPRSGGASAFLTLSPSELIQFKYWNPDDPDRGLSPLSAAAAGIELDMLAMRHDRSVMKNGARPAGILADKTQRGAGGMSATERKQAELWFKDRFEGVDASRSTMVLPGDLEWIPTALTPEDMEWAERRKWTREEVLAVMRTPKSVLSISEDLPYANQIAQDRNFWRGLILPMMAMFEDKIDASLLYPETDDIYAGFDLSGVEALRAGLTEQLGQVKTLTGPEIHMPPENAFEVVGLDMPEYKGSDTALVSPLLAPAEMVVSGEINATGPDSPAPTTGTDPVKNPDEPTPIGDGPSGKTAAALVGRVKSEISVLRAAKFWNSIIAEVQFPGEKMFSRSWRTWVRAMREKQLAQFDAATKGKKSIAAVLRDTVDPNAVVLDLDTLRNGLGTAVAPVYPAMLDSTFNFTVQADFGGVAVFAIDDPRLVQVMTRRQSVLLGNSPATLQRNLRESLRAGIDASETIGQLRQRIANVFDTTASSAKTLQVARTESAGFMNATRDEMFDIVGAEEQEWTTAGDEHVRESHVVFGNAGPKKRGFNYLSLTGGKGELRYPNDDQAPAGEVINCRCVAVMTK